MGVGASQLGRARGRCDHVLTKNGVGVAYYIGPATLEVEMVPGHHID